MAEGSAKAEDVHTPKPDPTVLTTEQVQRETEHLRREIAALRELVYAKIAANYDLDLHRHEALETLYNQRIEDMESMFSMHLQEARDALSAALDASQRERDKEIAASNKAIDKSEAATNKRFDDVNNFRNQFNADMAKMVSRDLFDQHIRESQSRVESLSIGIQENTNKVTEIRATSGGERDRTAEIRANVSMAIAATAIIVTIVLAFLTVPT